MNHEQLRTLVLGWPGVSDDFPFDADVLALRVGGKIFALTSLAARPLTVNLKCDPERALELRATWACVTPGYHMNKRHWNTVVADGSMTPGLFESLVRHSYDLVANSLPRKERERLSVASDPLPEER